MTPTSAYSSSQIAQLTIACIVVVIELVLLAIFLYLGAFRKREPIRSREPIIVFVGAITAIVALFIHTIEQAIHDIYPCSVQIILYFLVSVLLLNTIMFRAIYLLTNFQTTDYIMQQRKKLLADRGNLGGITRINSTVSNPAAINLMKSESAKAISQRHNSNAESHDAKSNLLKHSGKNLNNAGNKTSNNEKKAQNVAINNSHDESESDESCLNRQLKNFGAKKRKTQRKILIIPLVIYSILILIPPIIEAAVNKNIIGKYEKSCLINLIASQYFLAIYSATYFIGFFLFAWIQRSRRDAFKINKELRQTALCGLFLIPISILNGVPEIKPANTKYHISTIVTQIMFICIFIFNVALPIYYCWQQNRDEDDSDEDEYPKPGKAGEDKGKSSDTGGRKRNSTLPSQSKPGDKVAVDIKSDGTVGADGATEGQYDKAEAEKRLSDCRQVLMNDNSRKYLEKYLTSEFSVQQLHFQEDAENILNELRDLKNEQDYIPETGEFEQILASIHVYNEKYVDDSSDTSINISKQLRDELFTLYKDSRGFEPGQVKYDDQEYKDFINNFIELYEKTQRDIFKMIRGSFRRFKRTSYFTEMISVNV